MSETYLIALGSNMRHPRFGAPRRVLVAALEEMERQALDVIATSPIVASAPLGPSRRRYANAAALIETDLEPVELLAQLQDIEHSFGRRRRGQRWRGRVLDLDIVLWSGGIHASSQLAIPHPLFRTRSFVLGPAAAIAPGWRDPVGGRTLRQLKARLTRPRPLPRCGACQATRLGP